MSVRAKINVAITVGQLRAACADINEDDPKVGLVRAGTVSTNTLTISLSEIHHLALLTYELKSLQHWSSTKPRKHVDEDRPL